jgi:hypothetical protein
LAFNVPPPNDAVDGVEGDFKRQRAPAWWRALLEISRVLGVLDCHELVTPACDT